ncbi:hypothetical protein D3C75_551140 [compost metagenome]
MKKKLQVFISSTYTDMIEERQAAVSAVLSAGHIPAGMELFKSGDKSQKVTIQKWIQESDVYMLILGGRYGSIDEETGKSYTHWEYDYAGEVGKRRFVIVIDDKKLDEKARENPDYLEREHYKEYKAFKAEVLGNISDFYGDLKDIKITTLGSLKDFESDNNLIGWVKADQLGNSEVLRENDALLKENANLKAELEKVREQQKEKAMIGEWDYEELKETLLNTTVTTLNKTSNVIDSYMQYADVYTIGISKTNHGIFYIALTHLSIKLMQFGILEKLKEGEDEIIKTSKAGDKFLAKCQIDAAKMFKQQ